MLGRGHLNILWRSLRRCLAGAGCFNDHSTHLIEQRAEVAVICCCGPEMMAPASASTLPLGIMNVHDATFDLSAGWDMERDQYKARHIRDALWTVASALDKVIKECLGNPEVPSHVIRTIESHNWTSALRLGPAFGNQSPLQVEFDDRAHRLLPMALGNLIGQADKTRKWQIAGWYDASTKTFVAKTEVDFEPEWPNTKHETPRDWFRCEPGKGLLHAHICTCEFAHASYSMHTALCYHSHTGQIVATSRGQGGLPQCVGCPNGTYSLGEEATACTLCSPGIPCVRA